MKKKILIGVCIELVSSIILSFISWYLGAIKWYIAFVIFIIIFLVEALIIYFKSYRRIGLLTSTDKRSLGEILPTAESTVDLLVSWGGSLQSSSPYWQRELSEMANKGIKFRILILKPNSYGAVERRSRNAKWTPYDHQHFLSELMGIKQDRIDPGHWEDFRIALYDSEVCWSMAFVDEKRACIGFYGNGVGRDHPSLEIIRTKSKGLYDFYRKTYDEIWASASKTCSIHTVEDLNRLLDEDEKRKEQGLIFVLTGPCGSGKTSLTNALLQKNSSLKQLTTYTTRPQREKQEAKTQYVFVTDQEYEQNTLMNYTLKADYCSYHYGVSVEEVIEWRKSANDYIMDSIYDPDDLRRVFKERMVLIYLTTSKNQTMIERVRKRFNNSYSHLLLRAEHARTISANATLCDYIIYTDEDLDKTILKIEEIMKYSRESYNNTGRIVSNNEAIKSFSVSNQINTFGLPQDDVII